MNVVDLFCGCGGFSLSAIEAGFDVGLSVDIDPILTSSYSRNFPSGNLLLHDISKLSGKELISANGSKPDGIIGGPPCQGFSVIGKRKKSDQRNSLLLDFFRLVDEVQPEFFVMENVPGLITRNMSHHLKHGIDMVVGEYYITGPLVLDAADYGAASNRKRVLVIGQKNPNLDLLKFLRKKKSTSVKEAIGDLPFPRMSAEELDGHTFRRYRQATSSYSKRMRRKPRHGMGDSWLIELMGQGYVSGCAYTEHTPDVQKRFNSLRQGETDPISRYSKLEWDKPAKTLRAGTGKEGGSFQAARPIHPSQSRVINVREAARIQGFPDWFLFHETTWHSFRMIGNSVSPPMGTQLLKSVRRAFNESLPLVA